MKAMTYAAGRALPPEGFQWAERAHFDRLAEETGEIWWGSTTAAGKRRLKRRARIMSRMLSQWTRGRVLEIGCGTGALTEPLLRAAPDLELVACDISPSSVAVARSRCAGFKNATFDVADLLADPYPPESFDYVVGNSVLHHLHTRLFLPWLMRLLKPGGRVLFFEPNMLNPQIALERHVGVLRRLLQDTENETAFVRWRLTRELRQAGFVMVSVRPFDFLHPAIPRPLSVLADAVGRLLEEVPLLREIAGSLIICAARTYAAPEGQRHHA